MPAIIARGARHQGTPPLEREPYRIGDRVSVLTGNVWTPAVVVAVFNDAVQVSFNEEDQPVRVRKTRVVAAR